MNYQDIGLAIQVPFHSHGNHFSSYPDLVEKVSFKVWTNACPLCDAQGCAKFLQFYIRLRVYIGDQICENVKIARFICNRRNPKVPPGTHRTFSLLPYPLVPYSPYALDVSFEVTTAVSEHADNTYQTSNALASTYENITPAPTTLMRIKDRLVEAATKLLQWPQVLQKLKDQDVYCDNGLLSGLITMATSYRSPVLAGVSGACALSYDWFYLFQGDRPYMQRDFLFGTPSQRRLLNF